MNNRLRKRAEAAKRESDERFRALVMASSDALYQMSADWSEMRRLQEGKRTFFLSSKRNRL
ncbi:MAG TPA: hypothetical protein VF604_14060 [Pyrinomonadaceae bacterium]|jgi:hypothetical protein